MLPGLEWQIYSKKFSAHGMLQMYNIHLQEERKQDVQANSMGWGIFWGRERSLYIRGVEKEYNDSFARAKKGKYKGKTAGNYRNATRWLVPHAQDLYSRFVSLCALMRAFANYRCETGTLARVKRTDTSGARACACMHMHIRLYLTDQLIYSSFSALLRKTLAAAWRFALQDARNKLFKAMRA